MAWDATSLLEGDPDQPGELYIRVLVNPQKPFPLAMVECAADLDITIKITKQESEFPHLSAFMLYLTGSCMALSEFDMRLTAWQRRHHLPNKSEIDMHLDRIAQMSCR
jgi:hypothetical protein